MLRGETCYTSIRNKKPVSVGVYDMHPQSVPTRGRTLDHAAALYDFIEPIFMAGRQAEYNRTICALLDIKPSDRVLDLGCGTGVLTRCISLQLSAQEGGSAVGIDAAAKMVAVARKKRASATCRFQTAAAEELPFENESFDAVVSSLFFHHIDRELKARACAEAFRVLKPAGRLVVADMHTPTTLFGRIISYAARWLLLQPEISENIRGVLPLAMQQVGFPAPALHAVYGGYIAVFFTSKPEG